MSFSAEINDFVKGFAAGAGVGMDIKKAKLEQKKFDAAQAIDARDFAEKKRQFELGYGFDREKFDYERGDKDRRFGLDVDQHDFAKTKHADDQNYRGQALEMDRDRLGFDKTKHSDDQSYRGRSLELQDRQLDITEKGQAQTDARGNRSLDIREKDVGAKVKKAEEAETAADMDSLLPPDMRGAKNPAATYSDEYDYDEEVEGAYAEGGLVEDEEGAIPTEAPAPVVNREIKVDKGADPLFKQAQVPIADAMRSFTEESKAPAAPQAKPAAIEVEPKASKKDQDRITIEGQGAATPEEIKAIDSKIDPDGQLEPFRKGAARLVTAYNYFLEKGEPDKARAIAKRIIAYDKLATQTLGKLAQNSAENGDMQSASKLLMDAYNNHVPDGQTMSAQPTPRGTVLYKIERGPETIDQGELGRREIWSFAAGVADGSAYIDRMADVAAAGDTSAGNSGGKRGSYSQDVAAAATAKKTLDELRKQAQNVMDVPGMEKQAEALKAQLDAAAQNYTTAMQRAERAAAKTGRPPQVFEEDLKRRLGVSSALPVDAPAGAAPEGGEAAPAGERSTFRKLADPIMASTPMGMGHNVARGIVGMFSGGDEAPAAQPSGPVQVKSKAEFDALPSGAQFIAPDGSVRRKP